tara:strand:- start:119 stop:745 length:627 start_codon:yes stop_codon:yes gene_type:complete
MMGLSPRSAGGGDYFWRVTDEPYKVTGYDTGGAKYDTWRLPLTVYDQGGDYSTYATRRSSAEGWQPGMNIWGTRQIEGSGDTKIPGFDISFANWAGTPGAYTSTPYTTEAIGQGMRHPVFGGLLASPGDHRAQDPTTGLWTENIPWLAKDYGGEPWMTKSQPTVFSQDPYTAAGWGFQPIYGREGGFDSGPTTNILGFGSPTVKSSWD